MIAEERHKMMISLLQKEGAIRVDDLCHMFSVTSETVRRDLVALEETGILKKVHGGAVLVSENFIGESSFMERNKLCIAEKKIIADLSCSFIQERDAVMLDVSSTTFYLAKLLSNIEDIVIITNSLQILHSVDYRKAREVIGLGGQLDVSVSAFIGMQTLLMLENYYATHSFISCYSLDSELGMMDLSYEEATIKEKMLSHASVKYLLIDNSKFGKKGAVKINGLDTIDYFITDKCPDDEWLEFFSKQRGSLIYPKM